MRAKLFIAWAQARGLAVGGEPSDVFYVLLGAVSMFAHPAEAELVTNGRSREPDALDRYVDLVLRMLLPGMATRTA